MEKETLKAILGIGKEDTGKDALLDYMIADVEETILNYCHVDSVPAGLENTAYRMAADLYRYEGFGSPSAPVSVASVSEGDTSTGFISTADALAGSVLKDYRAQLNRYRRLLK